MNRVEFIMTDVRLGLEKMQRIGCNMPMLAPLDEDDRDGDDEAAAR